MIRQATAETLAGWLHHRKIQFVGGSSGGGGGGIAMARFRGNHSHTNPVGGHTIQMDRSRTKQSTHTAIDRACLPSLPRNILENVDSIVIIANKVRESCARWKC